MWAGLLCSWTINKTADMLRPFFTTGILLLMAVVTSAQQPVQGSSARRRGNQIPRTTVAPTSSIPAQNRSDLEKERAAIQKEMNGIKRSLGETHRHHRESLAQLALLQQQLSLRESAIRNINGQVSLIRTTMNESGQETLTLQRQLDSLRARYAESIVVAYKNRNSSDYLSFIFSATSFNDALVRMQYLRSCQNYRTAQAESLRYAEQRLQEKIDVLRAAKLEKEVVLKKENKERTQLGEEKKEKDATITRLQGQEKELEQRIAARQRQDRKLSAAIAAVMMRAKKETGRVKIAEKKALGPRPETGETAVTSTMGAKTSGTATGRVDERGAVRERNNEAYWIMTERFEREKGYLPWPAESGSVAMSFGLHIYPNHIKGNNLGLTIAIAPGSPVKTVFDGEVAAVFTVEDVEAVIIRHGKYYTTYSNLSTTLVRKGDIVKMGQVLGQVAEIGQLEFIISDDKDQRFDPEKWLKK